MGKVRNRYQRLHLRVNVTLEYVKAASWPSWQKKNYPSTHVTPWSIRLTKEIGIRYSTNRDQYELGGICTGESIVETFSNRSEWFTKPKLTVSIVKKNGYLPQKIRPQYVGGGSEPTVVFCVVFIYFQ